MQTFQWTRPRKKAAVLLAEGKRTETAICATIGIHITTLCRWKQHPDFQAEIKANLAAFREAELGRGIADRAKRIELYNNLTDKLLQVIEERAERMGDKEAGTSTGLVVRTVRVSGSGSNAIEIIEYSVDNATIKELRALAEQAAKDLGQWKDTREITGKDGGPVEVKTITVEVPPTE